MKIKDVNTGASFVFKQADTLFTLNYESFNSELWLHAKGHIGMFPP